MGAPKLLVVFYSRSGTTRRIAKALSEALKCDLEEITEAIATGYRPLRRR
jgi:flavodoxin